MDEKPVVHSDDSKHQRTATEKAEAYWPSIDATAFFRGETDELPAWPTVDKESRRVGDPDKQEPLTILDPWGNKLREDSSAEDLWLGVQNFNQEMTSCKEQVSSLSQKMDQLHNGLETLIARVKKPSSSGTFMSSAKTESIAQKERVKAKEPVPTNEKDKTQS